MGGYLPDLKHILFATDLSDNAAFAFGYAVSLASRFNAGLSIIHVVEELPPTSAVMVLNIIGEDRWKQLRNENEHKVLELLRKRIETFCNENFYENTDQTCFSGEIIVKIGNPVEQILQQLEKGEYDILVMGSRGNGILSDVTMGSTSRRVLRRCKKPVLIIQLPESKHSGS